MPKTALVIGAGMAGATSAYLLNKEGFQVTVVEADSLAGAGVRTRWYGGHPYTFGPRVFFSREDDVIRQLTSLIKIREYYTRTWTYVAQDGQLYHYPITDIDLPLMPDYATIKQELDERKDKTPSVDDFQAYWLSAIGPTLYNKFIDTYSKKMWGIESNHMLSAKFEWVNKGTPIRTGDTRLYGDQFQGYPEAADGYNTYFDKCLDGSTVHFSCRALGFDPETRTLRTERGEMTGDIIVNTGHVDTLFGYQYGKLRYCGRQFLKVVLPTEHAFPEDVTWIHYAGDEQHTRVTEFKQITNHKAKDTLIGIEIPSAEGREYPVQSEVEIKRFAQYKALFPANFFSIGRQGSFQYKGIPDAIRDSLDVVKAVGRKPGVRATAGVA